MIAGRPAKTVLLVGLASAAAFAVARPALGNPYPLDLTAAVQQAYAPTMAVVRQSCEVWAGSPSRESALVVVGLPGGRTDVAALIFINTAGWLAVWKRHAPIASSGYTPYVQGLLTRLRRTCRSGWGE
jgi:hypothetical protein